MSSLNSGDSLKKKVLSVIKEISPQLEAHGGGVELAGIKGKQITLRILGACLGCSHVQETFGQGMEEYLKERVPEIQKVEFVS